MHDALLGFQFGGGHVPLRCGGRHQHGARGGTDPALRQPVGGRRGAATGDLRLILGGVEVGLLHAHVRPVHVELLGDQHGQHRLDALTDFGVLGGDGDDAIGRDAHEGTEHRIGHRRQTRV